MTLPDPRPLSPTHQRLSRQWPGRQTQSRAVSSQRLSPCLPGRDILLTSSHTRQVLHALQLGSGSLRHLWGSCSALGVDILVTVCFTSVYSIPAELQDVMFKLGKPSALPACAWPAWIYHQAARKGTLLLGKLLGEERRGGTPRW